MEKLNEKAHQDIFKTLIEYDTYISRVLSVSTSNDAKLGRYRPQMKWLEYSCHGIFWIPGSIICLWFSSDQLKQAFFFNVLVALLIDIVCVAIIKASIRRPRPSYNQSDDMFLTVSVDKMSCPSGHTSRAVLMSLLLMEAFPGMFLLHPILVVWSFLTSVSRIMLGRHYLGDVIVGVLLGYVEYFVMSYIWAGPDTAKWYLDFLSDSPLTEDL